VADAAGIPSVLHCDGDARQLMPDMVTAGFVAVHGDAGGGPAIRGALAAAREAGLTFIGGLPTAALDSDEMARDAGVHALEFAREGGLIVSDDGGLATPAQVAALLVALGTVRASV
jgi:hypothetical protein